MSPSTRLCPRLMAALTAVLSLTLHPAAARVPQAPDRPRLVVLLMVDQMRADYIPRYGDLLQSGLRRLATQGAWYQNASFPYLNTVTCAGHSTVATGSFPYRHGMIMNGWFVRDADATETCTEDPSTAEISYGTLKGPGESAKRMLQPTLAELMHRGGARTVSLSLKPRSAIGMAGHEGTAVIWFDERGAFTTSTAFAPRPDPVFSAFAKAHPIDAARRRVWDRTLLPERYLYDDEADGERPINGWGVAFPHALGAEDRPFYARWQQSPFSDDYLELMGEAAIDGLGLGSGPGTDFLGISFSALDLVGHAYGPRSHEVQDTLVRLDLTIARLLNFLDTKLGEGSYVLALSSDHGVADIPEQVSGMRLLPDVMVRVIDETLRPILKDAPPATLRDLIRPFTGEGVYVAAVANTDVYFQPGVFDRLKQDARAMSAVVDALQEIPAVARVLRGDSLAEPAARASADPVIRAAALSYMPGRSGDLVVIPKEDAVVTTAATTHGTLYDYDQQVPIIFYGAGVRLGVYADPATPADIAVTLASLIGITLPAPDGHVLHAVGPRSGSGR